MFTGCWGPCSSRLLSRSRLRFILSLRRRSICDLKNYKKKKEVVGETQCGLLEEATRLMIN